MIQALRFVSGTGPGLAKQADITRECRVNNAIIKIAGIQQKLAWGLGFPALALIDQLTDHARLAHGINSVCHDDACLIGQDGGSISRRKTASSLLTLHGGLWLRQADTNRIGTLAMAPSYRDPRIKHLLTGVRSIQLLPALVLLL